MYNITNSSGIQIGSHNHMKIEEQNQDISTSPVGTEASFLYYESTGIFGKMYLPSFGVWSSRSYLWESLGLDNVRTVQLSLWLLFCTVLEIFTGLCQYCSGILCTLFVLSILD